MTCKVFRLKELFPEARDWIDAGRQEIRCQVMSNAERVYGESRKRCVFPIGTAEAFNIVRDLGYDASRSYLDSLIRRGRMQLPTKNGRFLAWGIENIVNFAMQLERMRRWKRGCYDEKKTCWELQAECELQDVVYTADDYEVQEVDVDEMFGAVNDPGSIERRAEPANSSADRLDTSDAAVEALLGESIEEPSTSQRKDFEVVLGGGKRSILRGRRRMGGAL